MYEWVALVGDALIAAVIFYEIEEHRASTFLSDVQGAEFYKKRAQLYDKYAHVSGATPKERAEAFRNLLWEDPELRELCDSQYTDFCRLRYMLRYSPMHRSLLAKWFPQVMVSFWAITAVYQRERNRLRPTPIANYYLIAVRESLKELKKYGLSPVTIYSRDSLIRVEITGGDLEKMLTDLDAPFK
jgi:hypothetical protein